MIEQLIQESEKVLKDVYQSIDDICFFNSQKVLAAFQAEMVSESDFAGTTGYGYGDVGRDKIERIYARIFKAEDALVRNQFISGTHAISTALFAILRPNDTLLAISGKPYDTLDEIIGLKENPSSLKSFGINYEQIDLVANDFAYDTIKKRVAKGQIKMIAIQRSKGYALRKSLTIKQVAKVIKMIKKIDPSICIMVDNCYCEMVAKEEPCEVGADLCVGSLIKNLGGGMASNGAYIVGRQKYIKLCAERLNMAGEGKAVGPSEGANLNILKGLYLAPNVVKNALKTAVLASYLLEKLGYEVEPKYQEERADIVEMITFKNKNKLMNFIAGIQKGSAVDSFVVPVATDMPGYDRQIIMASGSFTQGSSIELSCDGPLDFPYVAFLQGSLTQEYGKLGLITALQNIEKENNTK